MSDGFRLNRMLLRRHDGRVYLQRWGFEHARIGGVLLHRMTAPDPGLDLHDHPWTFVTIPLIGEYLEERNDTRDAVRYAVTAEEHGTHRGYLEHVRRWRPRLMRLDECHRITLLLGERVWTLVIHGPKRRRWGFYTPLGYLDEKVYDDTVRVHRRDLWNEERSRGR